MSAARTGILTSVSLLPNPMAYDSFQDFLHRLEREGELCRISEPVDVHLQITEIADRMMKRPDGGKALLFDKPTGITPLTTRPSPLTIPVAINCFGSRKRMAMALVV